MAYVPYLLSVRERQADADLVEAASAVVFARCLHHHPAGGYAPEAILKAGNVLGNNGAQGLARGFIPWKSIWTGLCMRTVLQMSHFELFARGAELGERILQMIGQQGHSEQIRGGALVVQANGFRPQVLPVLERAVAATEPSQGHQIDLLVLGQRPDEASQLRDNGIVGVVLQ